MPKNAPDGRTDGQRHPEAEAEVIVQQGIAVSADCVEGDIAQIEQSGQSHHDIEPSPA